jgi:hypothetical protein
VTVLGETWKRSIQVARNGGLFRGIARATASRTVCILLALYAFCTDWLISWHGLNFALRGLIDEPAHLATALVVLGALTRFRGSPPEPTFGWTMLACSVLIDLDHLPTEFGVNTLTEGTPRPYTHALWTVIVLTLAWERVRSQARRTGRPRPTTGELMCAGAAWGVAAHFLRDLATAPMSFWWPLSDMSVQVPYWWYVIALAIIIALPRGGRREGAEPGRLAERALRDAVEGANDLEASPGDSPVR